MAERHGETSPSGNGTRIGTLQSVIGLHGAFGELHNQALGDVCSLCRERAKPGLAMIIGDWGVDWAEQLRMHTRSEPACACGYAREEARARTWALADALHANQIARQNESARWEN